MKTEPMKTLPRSAATEWRDYAVYPSDVGAFVLNGVRVRIESVYCVPTNLEPRWAVTYWSDEADRKAVELIGATPYDVAGAATYGWNRPTTVDHASAARVAAVTTMSKDELLKAPHLTIHELRAAFDRAGYTYRPEELRGTEGRYDMCVNRGATTGGDVAFEYRFKNEDGRWEGASAYVNVTADGFLTANH